MKFIGLALALCFTVNAVHGQARLVSPKGSGFTNPKRGAATDGLSASFRGQGWVSGTFIARVDGYALVPDAQSINKLPHFVLNAPPYFLEYKVQSIEIKNGPAALQMMIGPVQARRLSDHKIERVRVTGSFLIERYAVSVECDAPWAHAVIVKAVLPEQSASLHLRAPETC